MILPLFQSLGIANNEARVYLALAELGRASAQHLSRKVSIPRTTIYSILDRLIEVGLVSLEEGKKLSMFSANRPDCLLTLLERQKIELDKKRGVASKVIDLALPYFLSQNLNFPKIQYFEGQKEVSSMLYNNLPEWEKSLSNTDSTFWGFQDHTFAEQYRDWLDYSWKRRSTLKSQYRICLFSNDVNTERKLKGQIKDRNIKFFPKEFNFDTTFWVGGDFLCMVYTREKPHYALQIKDVRLTANLRMVFRLLWELIK